MHPDKVQRGYELVTLRCRIKLIRAVHHSGLGTKRSWLAGRELWA